MSRTDDLTSARRRDDLRRYQQGAFLLAALALVTGLALLPRGDELLLIHVRNREIDRARAVLVDGAQGVSSAAAVQAHNELSLLEGRVDEAIADLERYAHDHAADADAWRRLAQMYGEAQRLDDQVRATARVYALQPTTALARRLVTFYRWSADERAEGRVLRDLVGSGEATADEHLRSARIDAAFGQPADAFATLEQLRRRQPGAFDYAAIELYASVRLEVAGAEGLTGPVQLLPAVQAQPELLLQLARTLAAWGHAEAALALFDTAPGVEAPPQRTAMRLQMAVGTPAAPRIVRELVEADAARALPAEVADQLVNLALSIGDYAAVQAVVAKRAPADEQGWRLRAVSHALSHDDRPAAQRLLVEFGDELLVDSPILALELAAERGDAARAREWVRRLDGGPALHPDELTAVASLEAAIGDEAAAFARLARVLGAAQAPDWAGAPFARLAVSLHQEEQALRILTPRRGEQPSRAMLQALDDLYAHMAESGEWRLAVRVAERLADARGSLVDAERLEYALLSAVPANPDLWADMRQRFLASLAEDARDRRLGEARRLQLVDGLWAGGERASLLDPIATLAEHDLPRWLSPLVEAARAAGRPGRAAAIIGAALPRDRDRAPASPFEVDAVRALLDLAADDAILAPQLERFARTVGETWVFAYDEYLATRGDQARRVELWNFVGRQPFAEPGERRAAAARLAELGSPRDAAEVLQPLTVLAGPSDADVLQLLALRDASLAPADLETLQHRLLGAAPAEQAVWLQHLAPRLDGQPGRLAAIGEQLLALREVTPETLSVLGHAALARNATDLAFRSFAAVRARRPADLDAVRWVGTLAFYAGRTAEARAGLEDYVARGGREPEPLYQLAELLRGENDEPRAQGLYRQALEGLDGPAGDSQRPLLANVLVRVGDRDRAARLFDALLAQSPAADHVRADYVVALVQWDDFAGASRVLAAQPASAPAAAGDAGGARRLDLLRVQVLTHDGQYAAALRLLDRLAARYPDDADVLVARGAFDADRGRTADADTAFAAATRVAPARADIRRLHDRRTWQGAPQLAMTTEARSISDAWDERSTLLSATGRIDGRAGFAFTAERRQVVAPRVLRADGSLQPLRGDLQRIEAVATLPVGRASTLAPALFAAAGSHSSLGGGLQWTRDDLRGRTELAADLGRPFWEFVESAADDGVRDRLAITRQWRIRPDTAGWAQVGWQRYRLASGPRAESLAMTLGVIRTIRREAPGLTLQYGLDKESRRFATTVTADSGLTFAPVPLVSREVHLAALIARFSVPPGWDGEATAGYTVDRLGGRGSFFTARVAPRWGARAGLSFWIDRRLYALATTQQALRGGAQLMVRFRR